MNKKIILVSVFFVLFTSCIFLFSCNAANQILLSQEMGAQGIPIRQELPQAMVLQVAQMPPRFPLPTSLPPAIFIKGKEGNINRVFIEDAMVGKETLVDFIIFDINPKEELKPPKIIGLPTNASFKVETMELEKNKAFATFTWTPTEKDIGLHAIAIEVSNSMGDPNRVALFYDVKK